MYTTLTKNNLPWQTSSQMYVELRNSCCSFATRSSARLCCTMSVLTERPRAPAVSQHRIHHNDHDEQRGNGNCVKRVLPGSQQAVCSAPPATARAARGGRSRTNRRVRTPSTQHNLGRKRPCSSTSRSLEILALSGVLSARLQCCNDASLLVCARGWWPTPGSSLALPRCHSRSSSTGEE